MKYHIFSWNINGIRAVLQKNALSPLLEGQDPDILCLQEIKARPDQVLIDLPDYQEIWNPAERPGYSGTAILTKTTPVATFTNFSEKIKGDEAWAREEFLNFGDPLSEGRVLTAEYPEFFLVNVYTPNSKHELSRLSLRHELWDKAFLAYLKELEKTKPVVACGDFNAAHTEIDLARPKDNVENAGFTPEEREGIDNITSAGFIDTFRALHPDEQKYTWWTWRAAARARNIGWRIDYFFISESLKANLRAAEIHNEIMGSDHCPISVTLEF